MAGDLGGSSSLYRARQRAVGALSSWVLKPGPCEDRGENYPLSPSVSSPMLSPSAHHPLQGLGVARTPLAAFQLLCNAGNSC